MNMRQARKSVQFRLSEVLRLNKFWHRQLRRLNEHLLIDTATNIEIRSQDKIEKGLMISLKSALIKKDRITLAEISTALTENYRSKK